MMRDYDSLENLARVAQALELDHPQVRASLAASQLIGLAMLRYVVQVEPLASAPPAKLAAWIGPTLQRYFTDPHATRPSAGPPWSCWRARAWAPSRTGWPWWRRPGRSN